MSIVGERGPNELIGESFHVKGANELTRSPQISMKIGVGVRVYLKLMDVKFFNVFFFHNLQGGEFLDFSSFLISVFRKCLENHDKMRLMFC